MNHLTDDQLAEWLAGAGTEATRAHLANCLPCHDEALALRDDLSRYAIARRNQARRAWAMHLDNDFSPRKRIVSHRLRWASAAALALLLAVPTAWMMRFHAAPAPISQAASASGVAQHSVLSQSSTTMSDDELLEAVNNDINRDVPQALAPVGAITLARNEIAVSVQAAANANGSVKEGEAK